MIKATSVSVAEQIELKKRDYRKKNEPGSKRRIEGDIKKLRQHVKLLTKDFEGELGSKKKQKLKNYSKNIESRKKD